MQDALCIEYNVNTRLHRLQFSKKKFLDVNVNKTKIIWEKNRKINKTKNRPFCLDEDKCELCLDTAIEHYERVMYTVNSRMLFQELQEGFDVLRERGFGRYDMTVEDYDKVSEAWRGAKRRAVRTPAGATTWVFEHPKRTTTWTYRHLQRFWRCVDFWRSYKIGQSLAQTAPYVAVLCTRGRSERDGCIVL